VFIGTFWLSLIGFETLSKILYKLRTKDFDFPL